MKRWLIALLSGVMIACTPAPIRPPLVSPTPLAPTAPVEIPAPPIAPLTAYLSEQTQIASDKLRVERVEAIDWPDSCLGLAQPDEMCLQVVTPGFRVEFAAPEKRFVVHSDRTGRLVRLKP